MKNKWSLSLLFYRLFKVDTGGTVIFKCTGNGSEVPTPMYTVEKK